MCVLRVQWSSVWSSFDEENIIIGKDVDVAVNWSSITEWYVQKKKLKNKYIFCLNAGSNQEYYCASPVCNNLD